MTVEIKCNCRGCDGHLSFSADDAGQTINCPHCGVETMLFVPTSGDAGKRKFNNAALSPKRETKPEDWLDTIARAFMFGGIAAAAIILTIGIILLAKDGPDALPIGLVAGGLVVGFNGFVISVLFNAAAEIIRLLRKISNK